MLNKDFKEKIVHWMSQNFCLMFYDIVVINLAYFMALLIRFDLQYSEIPQEYLSALYRFAPIYTVIAIGIFVICRLYSSLWKYVSIAELNRILIANIISVLIHIVGITIFFERMPASYYLFGTTLQIMLTMFARLACRYILSMLARRQHSTKEVHNVMIIGAGAAGQTILRELTDAKELYMKPCCVIDDDPAKWDKYIRGIPIVGGRDDIRESVKKYQIEKIFLAIPTASVKDKKDILEICQETGCELKSLPGIYQLANGEVTLSSMKAVEVEDLLGREPIRVNMKEIFDHIRGKRILVTGGGGSIGSELCRQIAAHEPEQLIIFDIYENNAYEIEQELRRKYGESLNLVVLIGSVRDSRRINMVFETYKPQLVYHAAAHKHVPLMETSPNEAIKNNVMGTYKTAYAAMKYGAERFVLISTDKAVNPTNIMGASKRLCEMVIQSMDAVSREGKIELLPFLYGHQEDDPVDHMAVDMELNAVEIESVNNKSRKGTQFMAVRFGNVLGSNGSVIPLFKKQIEAGGPVTVTHPKIVRYFMTIPEAVSLVLQAGTFAWGGEIFVLDMGEPVRIADLANNLIRLSGLTPGEDIKIEYTGLRPGEKLYEERLMAEEGLMSTENKKIHIGKPIPFEVDVFLHQLEELAKASYENSEDIVPMVEKIVTTFHPAKN